MKRLFEVGREVAKLDGLVSMTEVIISEICRGNFSFPILVVGIIQLCISLRN